MSRTALAGLGLLFGTPAAAQTAAEAMARHARLTGVDAYGCTRAQHPDEILVCGEREIDREQRLPYPAERGDRTGPRRATGEIAAASAAPVHTGSCGVVADGRPCNGGLDMFGVASFLGKLVTKIVDPEAEVEPVPPIPTAR